MSRKQYASLQTVLDDGVCLGACPIGPESEGDEAEYLLDGVKYIYSRMPGEESFYVRDESGYDEEGDFDPIYLEFDGTVVEEKNESDLFDLGQRVGEMMRDCPDKLAKLIQQEPEDFQTVEEHERGYAEGWAIFNGDTVQRVDEYDGEGEHFAGLGSDDDAIDLARRSGLIVDDDGTVRGRWCAEKLARALDRLSRAWAGDDGQEEEDAIDSLLGMVGSMRTQD